MNLKHNAEELNRMIMEGQILEAFEKFYADDVIMQENSEDERVGKDVNREFEKQFVSNVESGTAKLVSTAYSDDGKTVMNVWDWDITFKDGNRMKSSQVAVQEWKDGKIVRERFFYNSA